VIRLFGCDIGDDEAGELVAALSSSERASSQEAAAALRWGTAGDINTDRLEPDIRETLLAALATTDSSAALGKLREALEQHARRTPTLRRITRRLHNPRLRHCECLSDCWCKRTTVGHALRWYIPGRYHSDLSAGGAQNSTPRAG